MTRGRRRRAQFVLLAAAVVAVALVPVLGAYLQLGYAGDVRATGAYDRSLEAADRALERGLRRAARDVPRRYGWTSRHHARTAVQARFAETMGAVETTGVRETWSLALAPEAARDWAVRQCPRGPDREFGRCVARDGLVVQNRSGRTHVLAAAVRVRVASARERTVAVLIVERSPH